LVGIAEKGFLSCAETVRDRVVLRDSCEIGNRVGIYDIVLLVVSPDFDQVSGVGAIGGDELGNHRHGLGGIDHLIRSIKRLISHAERVEIATIFIADSAVSVVSVATIVSVAPSLSGYAARVGSESGGDTVGFPNIKFGAAGAVPASSGVGVGGGGSPIHAIGLSVYELDIMWTLCIAISGSIFSSCLVSGELGSSTVSVHFYKIKCSVQTARKIRDINIYCKLSVLQLEDLIRVGILH
jgi:hypothetical protein